MKDVLITMSDGTKKRLEIAYDMDKLKINPSKLNERLTIERQLLVCINELSKSTDFENSLKKSIEILNEFINCRRIYLIDLEENNKINKYELCRGCPPILDKI